MDGCRNNNLHFHKRTKRIIFYVIFQWQYLSGIALFSPYYFSVERNNSKKDII